MTGENVSSADRASPVPGGRTVPLDTPSRTSALARHLPLLIVIGLGLSLRLLAAYVVYPNQGYAGDLGLFQSWAGTLARVGPGAFYGSASSANYPPGYLYVLWVIGSLGGPLGTVLGVSSEAAVGLLLKLPAIAADIRIALLVFRAADAGSADGRAWSPQRSTC